MTGMYPGRLALWHLTPSFPECWLCTNRELPGILCKLGIMIMLCILDVGLLV